RDGTDGPDARIDRALGAVVGFSDRRAEAREGGRPGPERDSRRRRCRVAPSSLDRQRSIAHSNERAPKHLPERSRRSSLDARDLPADEDDGPDLMGHHLELGDEIIELLLKGTNEELEVAARLLDPEFLVEPLDALPELPEVFDVPDRERLCSKGGRQDEHL